MRPLLLVTRREIAAYLNSYWGYIVIAAVLMADGLLFNVMALSDRPKYSAAVMEEFYLHTFGLTCVASVFMTMRSVAEERQIGTIALIDSSPLSPAQYVGGKYLAALGMMALLLLATLYMPALVFVNGKVSYGQLFAGYFGLLLVAGATTAIGIFCSSISSSQLLSGVLAGLILVFFVVCWFLAKQVEPPLKEIIEYLSFYERHFRNFGRGQIHTESIVFYLSVTFAFLTMANRSMAIRRWR